MLVCSELPSANSSNSPKSPSTLLLQSTLLVKYTLACYFYISCLRLGMEWANLKWESTCVWTKNKLICRTRCSYSKKAAYTGTATSGEHKNAQDQKRDKEMLKQHRAFLGLE